MRTRSIGGVILLMSRNDLEDITSVVDVSIHADPVMRNVSDEDTRALSAMLRSWTAGLDASTLPQAYPIERNAMLDLSSIFVSMNVLGVDYYPELLERGMTNERLDHLSDVIWDIAHPMMRG